MFSLILKEGPRSFGGFSSILEQGPGSFDRFSLVLEQGPGSFGDFRGSWNKVPILLVGCRGFRSL